MNTRFSYDDARTTKKLEEMTFAGKYALDTPGPGVMNAFQEDVHLRLQGWGANQQTRFFDLDAELRGLGRKNVKYDVDNYHILRTHTQPVIYPAQTEFVRATRDTDPAWALRDQSGKRWEEPLLDGQHQDWQRIRYLETHSTRLEER